MVSLFAASSLLVLSFSDSTPAKTEIPNEVHGVWTVISASDNGSDMPMPENPGESLSIGECNFAEIIVCKTRIIMVLSDGSSIVAKTRLLTSEPQIKIEMVTSRYHDKQQEPKFVILKPIDGKKIQLAFCEKQTKVVNSSKGGKQFVLTAAR